MKAFFVLCVVLVAGIQAANLNLHPSELDKKATECIKETGVSIDVVNAAIDDRERRASLLKEDNGLMKFMHCFLYKAEFIDSEGMINIEKTLTELPPHVDKTEARKALQSCKRQPIWKV